MHNITNPLPGIITAVHLVFQMESLEAEHGKLSARAAAAVLAEERAAAECAEAQARAESAEGGLGKRVVELEAEAVQLRRELETRADATEASSLSPISDFFSCCIPESRGYSINYCLPLEYVKAPKYLSYNMGVVKCNELRLIKDIHYFPCARGVIHE